MGTREDLTGKQYNQWLVLRPHFEPGLRNAKSWCQCQVCMGEPTLKRDTELRTGDATCCRICSRSAQPKNTYNMVMSAIATAKQTAIADGSYKMPSRYALLQQVDACDSYFRKPKPFAEQVNAAYDAAVYLLSKMHEPSAAQGRPTKQQSLLAHLRLRTLERNSLPRLLGVSKGRAEAIVQELEQQGLIEIKRYPEHIDPQGKCDRIRLKQQQKAG